MKKDGFEDDGRVLADMSDIERRPLFLPRIRSKRADASEGTPLSSLSKDDRRIATRGAVAASLLIGGAFAGGMAVVIALLQLFWN